MLFKARMPRVVPIRTPAMQVMPGDKEQVSKMLMSETHLETVR